MMSFGKIGKYLTGIQNLLYVLCFIKILFSLFFYEYEPSFMKDMVFTLPLLLVLIVIPIIKKNIILKILNLDIIYVIILTCAFSIVFGDIFLY